MRYWFAFTVAIAGLSPALVTAQSTRPPVTDLSTPRPGAAAPAPGGTAGGADAAALRRTMADLTLELDQLRTQLRELRGLYETQTHELESLKSRNREALADTDKRLRELERKAAPAAAAAAETPAKDTPVVPVAGSANEQQEYDAAFGLMKQGMYERAAKSFREFLTKHPQSELAGNAQYWIGEAQYVVRNFKLALEEFTRVIDKYPTNAKVPDAMLKIGYVHHELGNIEKARQTLQLVVKSYPNTTSAKSAEKRLADLKAVETKKSTEPKKTDAKAKK